MPSPATRPTPFRAAPAAAWGAMIAAGAVLLCFAPALHHGFVNWDDQENFVYNFHYRGLAWANLAWMFTTFHTGPYMPLSWMTLALDYVLWGMNPFGYHLTSVLLHAANAALCFLLLRRLLGTRPCFQSYAAARAVWAGSLAGALLFAVHPLRVESVAWVTERRDVLSGLFYLLCLLAYVRRRTGPAWGFLLLSLLAKGWGVTLPAVLLIMDWYPLERRQPWRTLLVEKWPAFLLAAVFGILGLVGQQQTQTLQSLAEHTPAERVMQSFYGLAFYAGKTLLPLRLSPLYLLKPDYRAFSPENLAAAAAVIGLAVALMLRRRRWPWALAAALAYAVILLPVLGLFQMGSQVAADRYSYLACLPLAALAAAGLARLGCAGRWQGVVAGLAAGLALAGLGAATFQQCGIWRSSRTLWEHALRLDPADYLACNNLGNALLEEDRVEDALRYSRRALELNPDYLTPHVNICAALMKDRRHGEAVAHLQGALRQSPDKAELYQLLGLVEKDRSALEPAIRAFRRALELKPDIPNTRGYLAQALAAVGERREAIAEYRRLVQDQPADAAAAWALGLLLLEAGQPADALPFLQRAAAQQPGAPEHPAATARALMQLGRGGEALPLLRQALQGAPDSPEVLNNLAWLLATSPARAERRPEEAVRLAQRAAVLTARRNAGILDTLARAQAEAGRFEEATGTLEEAMALDEVRHNTNALARLAARCRAYRAGVTGD